MCSAGYVDVWPEHMGQNEMARCELSLTVRERDGCGESCSSSFKRLKEMGLVLVWVCSWFPLLNVMQLAGRPYIMSMCAMCTIRACMRYSSGANVCVCVCVWGNTRNARKLTHKCKQSGDFGETILFT